MNARDQFIVVEKHGGETTIVTLNRPEKRNALCIALLKDLIAAVKDAEKDPAMRILIIGGEGPVFCSGLDLNEAADPAYVHQSAELIAQALLALISSRLVTIACVHGAAIAGGAGLMSACDMAVCSADTKIGYPEPRRGLVAGLAMTLLRRQLRERDAREILLTSEIFSADRALSMGLVNRVMPTRDEAFAEGRKLAESVRMGGPRAVVATKSLLAELWPSAVKDDLDRALAAHLEARESPEADEGIAAFREKRQPKWAPEGRS
jgi:methylglutaconyl-CoA hydratase